ncbi:MAG: FecR domain-containing protein [Opitutaceae bacterium]|nr:FecR domain-containing protein [Opitutaceae bacterium]
MKLPAHHQDRIDRAIEGLLSAEELAAFHADVARDPVLRAAYVERAWLHGTLLAERERLPEILSAAPAAAPAAMARGPWFVGLGLVAAAAIALAFVGGRRIAPAAARAPLATLVQADNTKWAGSTLPTLPQSALGPGMFALVEGIATVRFASGAVVTIEAPTKLEIVSALRCRLIEGSLTAEVPPSAHGFAVETPDLHVVDIGTRFGVTAGSAGNSHVFVFDGTVEVADPRRSDVLRLTTGKHYHVGGVAGAATVEPNRAAPPQVIDGWTSITTAMGRGRDAYVRRGYAEATGGHPLLMVKHTDLERGRPNERRALLTFDLAELETARLSEVQLVLDPEPSGFGFVTMVPDSRFSVYGLKPGVADGWVENALTWENLPGCTDDGVISAQVEKVAEFWLPRGGSGEPFVIRGDALATFVRASRGGLVTFLLVRETGETDSTGLVHAFASKEHPTARPPTLRVR